MDSVMRATQAKRAEITAYLDLYEIRSAYNERVQDGAFQDPLSKSLPARPSAYDGPTYAGTAHMGGYGRPSAGWYWFDKNERAGYKPYGSAGQGPDSDKGVSHNTEDQSRFMLVTLVPLVDQSPLNRVVMEVGSYEFAEHDFATPIVP